MSQLVTVYDKRSNTKVPHLVPAHFVGHPVLGKHYSLTPRPAAVSTPAQKAAPASKEN